VPLLLGLPFLTANHIVIDFAACTAVVKEVNLDLLNPPPRKKNKRIIDEKKAKCLITKEKETMFIELISVCQKRRSLHSPTFPSGL
jgi:hypothetical protein